MLTNLQNFLQQFVELNAVEFNSISSLLVEHSLRKREHLFKAGEVADKLVFFFNGYFRFYHYLEDGTEVTSDFYFAPNIVTSYTSFITQSPSDVYVQAMEDMQVLLLARTDLYALYKKYHNIDKLGRIIAEQVAITSEKHLFAILNLSATERYNMLLENYSHFIQRIPLQYIASYLGITKESLSRIRKNLTM